MKRIIDTSEVLGTVESPDGRNELCVSAQASFDESVGKLVVELTAFLRPNSLLAKERRFRADWLPQDEVITEGVTREECHEVAREIFHSWTRRVRKAAAQLQPA